VALVANLLQSAPSSTSKWTTFPSHQWLVLVDSNVRISLSDHPISGNSSRVYPSVLLQLPKVIEAFVFIREPSISFFEGNLCEWLYIYVSNLASFCKVMSF